jgi:predicted Zn-dependent protease
VFIDLAEVLRLAGKTIEAVAAVRRARELYEEGTVPMIARTDALIAELEKS